MKDIPTVMGNIWAKRLEKNPALGNLPMVKAMMNLSARGKGPLNPGVAQAIQGGEQVDMPRMGMMGGRRMAEEIARRAGAVPGPRDGSGVMGMGGGPLAGRNADTKAFSKGGKTKVKKMAKGGSVSTASKRADGCATKGKTKGRFV